MEGTDRGQVLRIVDWNLNGFHTVTDDQVALLAAYDPDLLTLQEVLPSSCRRLKGAGYESGALARDLLAEPGRGTGRPASPRRCSPARRWSSRTRMPTRWRTCPRPSAPPSSASAAPPAQSSWPASPRRRGVKWGAAKSVQGDRNADWWVQRELPLVAGMDRNGPKFEGIDTVEWWPRDSMRLLGDDALHDLRAVYLDHLDQHPKRRQRIRDAQRADPLATSYDRGRARPVSSRYDAIYASPDFSVLAAGYDWQRAIEAGSDHALVWADLRLDGGAAAG